LYYNRQQSKRHHKALCLFLPEVESKRYYKTKHQRSRSAENKFVCSYRRHGRFSGGHSSSRKSS